MHDRSPIFVLKTYNKNYRPLNHVCSGGEGSHTFHLHGHSFHVVGVAGRGEGVRRGAEYGRLPRQLHNPVVKDTVTVPAGGAVALRFKADNPGKSLSIIILILFAIW